MSLRETEILLMNVLLGSNWSSHPKSGNKCFRVGSLARAPANVLSCKVVTSQNGMSEANTLALHPDLFPPHPHSPSPVSSSPCGTLSSRLLLDQKSPASDQKHPRKPLLAVRTLHFATEREFPRPPAHCWASLVCFVSSPTERTLQDAAPDRS